MKWPDGTTDPKELFFCPVCGEEEPKDPDAGSITDADHPRNEHGNLICGECYCERDELNEYEPVYVIPLDSIKTDA